jgi:MFS family permease
MESAERIIDFSKWGGVHWKIFSSLSMGYFMWGVIGTLAPLLYPSTDSIWILIIPIISQLVGDLAFSYISDAMLGRKTVFFITLLCYGIGSLLITISALFLNSNPIVILAGIVIGLLGVEGEVPVALSYASEIFPLKYREKVLVLFPNFDNIGAFIASLLAFIVLLNTNSYTLVYLSLGVFSIILIVFTLVIRYLIPESIRWLMEKGMKEKALSNIKVLPNKEERIKVEKLNKRVSLSRRFIFLVVISVSQFLTYGLMAFTVADYYFSGTVTFLIIAIANLGASAAGFIAPFLIDKVRIRVFSAFSYIGGAITMLPILALLSNFSLTLFYLLLILNMFFSEFAWAVRTILEPTLMPTKRRAFYIGLVRSANMISYSLSLYFTSSIDLTSFVLYNLALWLMGSAGAIYWYLRGYDVNYVPIEETSK